MIDLVIAPVAGVVRAFNRSRGGRRPITKILAVELWRLGDIVLTTPALQALRNAYPTAKIYLLAGPQSAELLRHQDVVDEIICFSAPWVGHRYDFRRWEWKEVWRLLARLRAEKFDVAIDFRGDLRDNLLMWLSGAPRRIGFGFAGGRALLTNIVRAFPDRHQADQALDAVATLGAPVSGFGPKLWPSAAERKEALDWLRSKNLGAGGRLIVAIHPGARWTGRRWEAGRFSQVAEWVLSRRGADVLLLGGPEDNLSLEAIARGLDRNVPVMQPSLRQLVAVLSCCDLLICVDSAAMHIATAVGTPVVALFGPQRPEWFGPLGEGHDVLLASVPCRPCDQIVCHRPESSCMRLVDVSPVVQCVDRQLARCRARRAPRRWPEDQLAIQATT